MRARIIAPFLMLLSLLALPLHWGARADGEDEGTIKVDATLVNIPVTVSDAQGRFIPSLKAGDFELYEDNVRQEIAFFSADNVPFTVALVLDVSGSTRGSFQAIQAAASEFVKNLRADDRVSVIAFSKEIEVMCDFTSNRDRLQRAINEIRSGGSTRLYDAVYATMMDELKAVSGRKAMILLTDGEDTTSRLSANQAVNAAIEAGAIVYVLQYPSDGGPNIARRNRTNDPWGRDPRARRYPDNSPFPRDTTPWPPTGPQTGPQGIPLPPGAGRAPNGYPPYNPPPGSGYPPPYGPQGRGPGYPPPYGGSTPYPGYPPPPPYGGSTPYPGYPPPYGPQGRGPGYPPYGGPSPYPGYPPPPYGYPPYPPPATRLPYPVPYPGPPYGYPVPQPPPYAVPLPQGPGPFPNSPQDPYGPSNSAPRQDNQGPYIYFRNGDVPMLFVDDQGGNNRSDNNGRENGTARRRNVSGPDFLRVLVDETGGNLYAAAMMNDLSGLAAKIAEELRHIYVLGYYPTKALDQGGYRRVKVQMIGKSGLKVRYKNGYEAKVAGAQTNSTHS